MYQDIIGSDNSRLVAKTSSEPMRTYHQCGPKAWNFTEMWIQYSIFHSWKSIWKCRLRPFVSASSRFATHVTAFSYLWFFLVFIKTHSNWPWPCCTSCWKHAWCQRNSDSLLDHPGFQPVTHASPPHPCMAQAVNPGITEGAICVRVLYLQTDLITAYKHMSRHFPQIRLNTFSYVDVTYILGSFIQWLYCSGCWPLHAWLMNRLLMIAEGPQHALPYFIDPISHKSLHLQQFSTGNVM